MARPLRLKQERVGKPKITSDRPYLQVLVHSGVYHLEEEFTYQLPESISVEAGDWVSVPFSGRNCTALVVARKDSTTTNRVLPINKKIKGPSISEAHLRLYRAVAERWGANIFDVLRFTAKFQVRKGHASATGSRKYLQLSPQDDEIKALKDLAEESARAGRTLLILPEERLVSYFDTANFDVGLRGSALSPNLYNSIIIFREDSSNHFELKSPGFNTRDVALIRNEILHENLLFVGFSPSLEMSRLIEAGYVSFEARGGHTNVIAAPALQGEFIPSKLFKPFRQALEKGPVLVITNRKGYGIAISCASCRNIASCKCGGRLSKKSRGSSPTCVLCQSVYPDWRCNFCGSERIYLLARGIDRIAEEFGATFTNTSIHIATAEKQIEGVISPKSIVLATAGSAPYLNYSATLFLDGLHLGADMRSDERYLATLFRYTAFAKGNALIVNRPENPAIPALTKWRPSLLLNRLLRELQELGLPPYSRHALIKVEESEADRIIQGLKRSIAEGRFSAETRIHSLSAGVISIFFPITAARESIAFIHELQRRRSLSGKELFKLRIDPYLLG